MYEDLIHRSRYRAQTCRLPISSLYPAKVLQELVRTHVAVRKLGAWANIDAVHRAKGG
jgi:hypothetical protein